MSGQLAAVGAVGFRSTVIDACLYAGDRLGAAVNALCTVCTTGLGISAAAFAGVNTIVNGGVAHGIAQRLTVGFVVILFNTARDARREPRRIREVSAPLNFGTTFTCSAALTVIVGLIGVIARGIIV